MIFLIILNNYAKNLVLHHKFRLLGKIMGNKPSFFGHL
ncbi:hypothetical protein NSP_41640 [Nodularia spumigena CCY9414]|nr:hypothetical protein NSP_23420 [Nodularia spumigena CCY9414]AHJ30464.1 hypothetical protein NSP_41640 [Nodularia spumigena CCY9414]